VGSRSKGNGRGTNAVRLLHMHSHSLKRVPVWASAGVACALLLWYCSRGARGVATFVTSPGTPTRPGNRQCEYGSLPGRWIGSPGVLGAEQLAAAPPRWQTIDPRCQLATLLDSIVAAGIGTCGRKSGGDDSEQPHRILMLGDSVDRTVVRDVCHAAAGLNPPQRAVDGQACMEQWVGDDEWACRLPGAVFAVQPFWGVSPLGPYNRNRTGAARQRIQKALAKFPKSFGAAPDLAVIGALLWDLARWKIIDPDGIMASDQLPSELLLEWMGNMEDLLKLLRAGVPSTTMLAVHTLPFPRLAAKPSAAGSLAHGTITRHAHVAQLNAAMRHLAGVHGYQVLDLEVMTSQFHQAGQYLADNTHPAPWLSRAVANILLNMAREVPLRADNQAAPRRLLLSRSSRLYHRLRHRQLLQSALPSPR